MNHKKKSVRIGFIGTGTEVGKSYAACALARELRQQGKRTLALKPIESGVSLSGQPAHVSRAPRLVVDPTTSFPRLHDGQITDAESLMKAAGLGARSLYELADPVSPHLAARREGIEILIQGVAQWVDELVTESQAEYLVLETAGGALSPVHAAFDNLDLLQFAQVDVIVLVAPNRLGVLHDVAATLRCVEARGLVTDLVVLSDAHDRVATDASYSTNLQELQKVVIPRSTKNTPRVHGLAYRGSFNFWDALSS